MAATITGNDMSAWHTAAGWGDHGTNDYLTSYTETDPVYTISVAAAITGNDTSAWHTAAGWGDHGTNGYLTSYAETDPNAVLVDGSRAMSGDLDMGDNSITNISTNSLVYSDGTSVATRYVDVTGDTMSGALALSAGGLTVGTTQLVVQANGNVGIGISDPTNALAVNGTIKCKEVIVTLAGWADFVFEDDYELMPLNDVDEFIRDHGHLPGMPSAEDVASGGVKMGEMQSKLLQRIEELTLHVIELAKENERLKSSLMKNTCPIPE